MTENKTSIHLSELDEFIASRSAGLTSPLRLKITRDDLQGNITISDIANKIEIEEGGIDFELSPSEYQSLDSLDIKDFTGQTIYTSSAYEFFDFIFMYFSRLECLVDFNGNSWRIKVLDSKE